MATMTFVVDLAYTETSDPVKVGVQVVENGGALDFTLTILSPWTGDLLAFYFDVADEGLIGTLSATGTGVTTIAQGDDNVFFVGSNATNMNGTYETEGGLVIDHMSPGGGPKNPPTDAFDFGVQIGTTGAGHGDVYTSFSFTLSTTADGGLELADLFGQEVGVRIQSTGLGELGDGSVKVIDEFPTQPDEEPEQFEGLSHGYWKNHFFSFDKGEGITVDKNTSFETFFGVGDGDDMDWIVFKGKTGTTKTGDINFEKALNGPAYGSAYNILAMQAVAAVLNACDSEINYSLTLDDILGAVQAAWDNDEAMLALAAQLDEFNNLGLTA